MSNFGRVRYLIRVPAFMKRLADDFTYTPFQTMVGDDVIPSNGISSQGSIIAYLTIPSAIDQIATAVADDVVPSGISAQSSQIHYLSVPASTDQIATAVADDVVPSGISAQSSPISSFLVPSS